MKIPTTEEFVKSIAEKAFNEYEYEGKTLRQWVEILKDYVDKQTTLQRIVERLEEVMDEAQDKLSEDFIYYDGYGDGVDRAIEIVREEGGLNENT